MVGVFETRTLFFELDFKLRWGNKKSLQYFGVEKTREVTA
jgi:hypothetical protein